MKKMKWLLISVLIAGLVLGGISVAFAGSGDGSGTGIFGKMFGRGFKAGFRLGVDDEKIADFLGITTADLASERKSGSSLAEIAAKQGKTEEELVKFIVTEEKARLSELLASGKITQDQYNDVISNLENRVREMVERKDNGKPFPGKGIELFEIRDKIAEFLGVSEETLIQARQDGKSLAAVAVENGKTEQQLIDFIYGEVKAKLDALLSEGKITQTQYENMVAALKDRIVQLVERTEDRPFLKRIGEAFMKGFGRGMKAGIIEEDASKFLGMTVQDLLSEQRSGKSLATIAEEKGKTREALIEYLYNEEKAELDALLSQGKITQDQYNTRIENLKDRITQIVERTCIGNPGKGRGQGKGGRP